MILPRGARILPPEEWGRLTGTELEMLAPHIDPAHGLVIVVERDGRIVGCWALFTILAVHGLWIDPEHRKRGAVAGRLWRAMQIMVHQLGYRAVETSSCSEDISALLAHAGATKLDGAHYVLPVKG